MSNIKSFQRLLVVQALYELSINENRSQTPINEIFANIVELNDYKKKKNNKNLKFAEKIIKFITLINGPLKLQLGENAKIYRVLQSFILSSRILQII